MSQSINTKTADQTLNDYLDTVYLQSHSASSVYVSGLDRINQFLTNRQDALNEKEIEKVVKSLSGFVTN